jgi:hypothetical protein
MIEQVADHSDIKVCCCASCADLVMCCDGDDLRWIAVSVRDVKVVRMVNN